MLLGYQTITKKRKEITKKIGEGSKNPPPSKVSRKRDQREARVKI
jgi:hypothetical protein